MKNYLLVLLILFLGDTTLGQGYLKQFNENIIFPDGYLILFHPYMLKFDTSFKGYITYNDSLLDRYHDNTFGFIPTKNGKLRIYNIDGLNDTVLLKEFFLKFKYPDFSVLFNGMQTGSIINKNSIVVKNDTVGNSIYGNSISVEVFNNDISLHIPVKSVNIKYYKNGYLRSKSFNGKMIPESISKEISNLTVGILVFEVEINLKGKEINLPPAVYFIR